MKKTTSLMAAALSALIAISVLAKTDKHREFTGTPKNAALAIYLERKDPGMVTIELQNVSKGQLYILNEVGLDESNTLGFHVKNLRTSESYDVWLTSDPIPPPPRSPKAFIRLLPGESLKVDVKLGEQLSKPGVYQLRALYESPIYSNSPMAFGLPMWGHEKGIIASAPLEVSVD